MGLLKHYTNKIASYYYSIMIAILNIIIFVTLGIGLYYLFLGDSIDKGVIFIITSIVTTVFSNELKLDRLREEVKEYKEIVSILLLNILYSQCDREDVEEDE